MPPAAAPMPDPLVKARVYLITQSPGNEIMEAFGHAEIEWDADGDAKTNNTILSFSPNIGELNKTLTTQWKLLNAKTLKEIDSDEGVAKSKRTQAKADFADTLTKIMKQDLAMSVALLDSAKFFLFARGQDRKIARSELILSTAQKKQITALFPMLTDSNIRTELPLPHLRYKYTEFNCSSTLRDLILSKASYSMASTAAAASAAPTANVETFFNQAKAGVTQVPSEIQKPLNESMHSNWRDLLGKSVAIAIQDSKTHSLLVSRPEALGMKSDDPYYGFVVSQTSFKSFDDMEKSFLSGELINRFLNLLSMGSEGAIVFNESQIKTLEEATRSLATDPSLMKVPNRYESMALPVYLQAELAILTNPETHQTYLKCVSKADQPFPGIEECKN